MDRRNFLKTTTMTAVALAASQRGFAKDSKKESSAGAGANDKLAHINKTAAECLGTAQACIAHCQESFEKGNTKMAKCLKDTLNMSAICEATSKLTGYHTADAETLKQVLTACSSLCKECSSACKEHAQHSAACKDCMEACDRCAEACDAYVKA